MSDWIDKLTPEERDEWDRIVNSFRRDALEKIDASAFVASVVPSMENVDLKFAMETGAAIMLDKPILLIVFPGSDVPPKLRMIADEIVETDLDTKTGGRLVAEAVHRMRTRFGGGGGEHD